MKSDRQLLKEIDKDLTRALSILSDHQCRLAVKEAHDKIKTQLSGIAPKDY